MFGERWHHLQPHVGEGADGQRNLLASEPLDERGILQAPHAVVDPLGVEGIEGPADRRGRTGGIAG